MRLTGDQAGKALIIYCEYLYYVLQSIMMNDVLENLL